MISAVSLSNAELFVPMLAVKRAWWRGFDTGVAVGIGAVIVAILACS